jgi:hypothetical protein
MYRKKTTLKRKKRGGGEETIQLKNGTYTGNLVDGKRNGQGEMKYKNGDVYNGMWKDDMIHGQGEKKYKIGDVYNGMWKDDKLHGQGEMKYHYGPVYNGMWKDNEKNEGEITYPNGDVVYNENWLGLGLGESIPGRIKFKNGDVYNGITHGQYPYRKGEMKYKDGGVYNGYWQLGDVKYGTTYTTPSERGIGKTYNKKLSSELNLSYYTVQKPTDLIIGKKYLLYDPINLKKEIAVFIKERIEFRPDDDDYHLPGHVDYHGRYNDYLFQPKSEAEKIVVTGRNVYQRAIYGIDIERLFDNVDLEFNSKYNQVLLFKDIKNPFFSRESKKIPDGPYRNTLEYMDEVRGGKTKKRKNKVMVRGKKRKTQGKNY